MPEEYFAINHSMSRRTPSTMDSAGILAEVAALNGAKGTITLGTGTWRIDLATAIPSNARFVVEQGAMLTKYGSGTLTINGPFEAPLAQVFSGFAAGEVLMTSGLASPQWWGAKVGSDDTLAVQCACSAFGGNGGRVEFSGTNAPYQTTGRVDVPQFVELIGLAPSGWQSDQAIRILHTPATPGTDCFRCANTTPGQYARVHAENLLIVGSSNSRRGFDIVLGDVQFRNITAEAFDTGFYLAGMINSLFDCCKTASCRSFGVDFDPDSIVSTSTVFRNFYFSGGGVTETLGRFRNATDVLLDGRCIAESCTGDAYIADGCSITLLNPYFENIPGAFLKAGQEATSNVKVVGGNYVGPCGAMEDAFFLDRVNTATLLGLEPMKFDRASIVRTTSSTQYVYADIPDNSVPVASVPRANSHAYVLGDLITAACDEDAITRSFICVAAGQSAGAKPAGYTRTTRGVTDGTAVFRSVGEFLPYDWYRASVTLLARPTTFVRNRQIENQYFVRSDGDGEWSLDCGYSYMPGDLTIRETSGAGSATPAFYARLSKYDGKIGFQGWGVSANRGAKFNNGLEVALGFQLTPAVDALPTADAGQTLALLRHSDGSPDELYACLRGTGGVYAWINIATGT